MALPPFLRPCDPLGSGYYSTVFEHKYPLGPSHVLWWPSKSTTPKTIILFIPGNPGLLELYTQFLGALHAAYPTPELSILAHSHIGHTPGISMNGLPVSTYSLVAQIEGCIEAFDALKTTFGVETEVVLVGHSVGAWLALQIAKARPLSVSVIFLLFPTISQIGETPNGRKLSWLFSPHLRLIVSKLSYITRIVPTPFLRLLFMNWPSSPFLVLQAWLRSPSSISATLQMAHDETKNILDLDIPLLNHHQNHLYFFFATKDDWVGKERNIILRSIHPDIKKLRVVISEIPHAFCINHGQQVALQCLDWLNKKK